MPVGHNVHLQMEPLSSAGKSLSEVERVIKEKFDEIKHSRRDQKSDSE